MHDWDAVNTKKGTMRHTFKSGTLRGDNRLKLMTMAKKTLKSGDVAAAVKLPAGEDMNEWFAMHVVDFYNEISLLYGIVAEIDTAERFPVMGAGKKYEYHWADATTQQPIKLSAPAYVDRLFGWIEDQLNDEAVFPTSVDLQFPANFRQRVSRIFRRLFRVYAHIYYSHFDYIIQQAAQAHVNSCFKHFVLFVKEFQLVDDKEMEPLKDVINGLLNKSREEPEEQTATPPPTPADEPLIEEAAAPTEEPAAAESTQTSSEETKPCCIIL